MKKSLVLVLIVLLASSALYADVSVGAWGRIITEVYGSSTSVDGDAVDALAVDPSIDMKPNWGALGGRVGFKIIGSADDVGFEFDVNGNSGANFYGASMTVGDIMCIWAKPMDIIKVTAGQFQIDTFRGKFGGATGSGTHYVMGDMEDAIFSRMRTGHGLGVEVTPVEGATLQAVITAGYDSDVDGNVEEGLVEDAMKTIQVGGGYNIPDVGLIRAQYIGENTAGGSVASQDVEVAFAYMGMEGLLVDAGVSIDVSDVDVMADKTAIGIGASYAISDAISATLTSQIALGQDAAEESTTRIAVHLAAKYILNGGLNANLEAAVLTETDHMAFNVYPYIRKDLANGFASIGFKFASDTMTVMDIDIATTTWSIPVCMEYWF